MRLFGRTCVVAALAIVTASCGGGGSSYNPPAPSPQPTQTPPPANASTISIVSDSGPQAFNPNPSPLPASRRLVWRNDDDTVHRIVANDGSFDTGNLGPGSSSTGIDVPANGARFHCTLHTTMVGSVEGTSGQPPPCTGLYC
jgi:plastocyanin